MNKLKEYKHSIRELLKLLKKSQFESTQMIYLPKPVLVGKNDKGDVLCTYISDASEGGLYMNVIFNERPDDLYGNNFEFTFICYNDLNRTNFTSLKAEEHNIEIAGNALTLVLNSLNEAGEEWIVYQRNLQIRSRYFHRWAIRSSRAVDESSVPELTWEEQLEWKRVGIETEKLSHNRNIDPDQAELELMLQLGEVEYKRKKKEQYDAMKPMLDDILAEILAEEKRGK